MVPGMAAPRSTSCGEAALHLTALAVLLREAERRDAQLANEFIAQARRRAGGEADLGLALLAADRQG